MKNYPDTIVDTLYKDYKLIVEFFGEQEVSLKIRAAETFRKSLLIAAASYFEKRVVEQLLSLVTRLSIGNPILREFVEKKALKRQYHTLFDWDRSNANSFFGLFGVDFREEMKTSLESDLEKQDSIKAFLEIGNERNRLVHGDFGNYQLEKGVDEIHALYQQARYFVESIEDDLYDFALQNQEE